MDVILKLQSFTNHPSHSQGIWNEIIDGMKRVIFENSNNKKLDRFNIRSKNEND